MERFETLEIVLPSVINYRPSVKSNNYYRSARWDEANEDDVKRLKTEFPVVLDLRSKAEVFFRPPPLKRTTQKLFARAHILYPSPIRKNLNVDDVNSNKDRSFATQLADQLMSPRKDRNVTRQAVNYKNPDGSEQKIVYINFTNFNYQKNVVWKRASLKLKLKMFWYVSTFNKQRLMKLIGSEIIAPRGYLGMMLDFVEYSKEAISVSLKELASSYTPVNLHCAQGIHRTSIVTALLLSILNYSRQEIIDDYIKCEEGLEPVRNEIKNAFIRDGLLPEMTHTPKEIIIGVLDFIDSKYGSVINYVKEIGVTDVDIALIKSKYY